MPNALPYYDVSDPIHDQFTFTLMLPTSVHVGAPYECPSCTMWITFKPADFLTIEWLSWKHCKNKGFF